MELCFISKQLKASLTLGNVNVLTIRKTLNDGGVHGSVSGKRFCLNEMCCVSG